MAAERLFPFGPEGQCAHLDESQPHTLRRVSCSDTGEAPVRSRGGQPDPAPHCGELPPKLGSV